MSADKETWNREGYLVLPGFYSHEEIDQLSREQQSVWDRREPRVVVTNINRHQMLQLNDVPDEDRQQHRFKVLDLYLENETIRSTALNDRISPILTDLLGEKPVLCNSLGFEHGSGQEPHMDSMFMTPRTIGHLVAIWIALEDCTPDAGPLFYYPGSHRIPPYIFSNGSMFAEAAEMDSWREHIDHHVRSMNLERQTFPARKGDVFIWSANMLHGGSDILREGATRKSLVFHYFTESDSRACNRELVAEGDAYWFYRAHQPVNGKDGEMPPRPQSLAAA